MEKIKKYWFKKKRYIKQRINLKNKMDFAITQQLIKNTVGRVDFTLLGGIYAYRHNS